MKFKNLSKWGKRMMKQAFRDRCLEEESKPTKAGWKVFKCNYERRYS